MKNPFELISGIIILIFMAVVFWQVLSTPPTPEPTKPVTSAEISSVADKFQLALEEAVLIEVGQPIEGYEPALFMQVFPGLEEADFAGVEAASGHYVYEAGELHHEFDQSEPMHSAGPAITKAGMSRLFQNVTARLALDQSEHSLTRVLTALKTEGREDSVGGGFIDVVPAPTDSWSEPAPIPLGGQPVACTMEARECPDGSFVGRIGPDCEFASCPLVPSDRDEVFKCKPHQRNAECEIAGPDPVCAQVEESCATGACQSVEQTYQHSCYACADPSVISYTMGACPETI